MSFSAFSVRCNRGSIDTLEKWHNPPPHFDQHLYHDFSILSDFGLEFQMSVEKKESLLSTPLHGIYIPSALLIIGTAILRREWIPFAVALAVILSFFKIFRGRES
jgi:hypothetical protein